jgi:hypothetical protein
MDRAERTIVRYEKLYQAALKSRDIERQMIPAKDFPMFIVSLMAASELSNIVDELQAAREARDE